MYFRITNNKFKAILTVLSTACIKSISLPHTLCSAPNLTVYLSRQDVIHMLKWTSPSPFVLVYCKWAETGQWGGWEWGLLCNLWTVSTACGEWRYVLLLTFNAWISFSCSSFSSSCTHKYNRHEYSIVYIRVLYMKKWLIQFTCSSCAQVTVSDPTSSNIIYGHYLQPEEDSSLNPIKQWTHQLLCVSTSPPPTSLLKLASLDACIGSIALPHALRSAPIPLSI